MRAAAAVRVQRGREERGERGGGEVVEASREREADSMLMRALELTSPPNVNLSRERERVTVANARVLLCAVLCAG